MFRTPNVTMDNRAGTSVIVRILQEPQDVLRVTLQTAPALRVTASSSTPGEKAVSYTHLTLPTKRIV